MKDSKGKELAPGQTVKRTVDGMAVDAGWEYKIELRTEEDHSAILVANGGFVREILDPERAKEFEIISE